MTTAVPAPQSQSPQEKSCTEGSPPLREATPLPQAVEPAGEPVVGWGDRMALQVWLECVFLLWTRNLFNLVAGLWGRWPG
jgi:hypothetical protein